MTTKKRRRSTTGEEEEDAEKDEARGPQRPRQPRERELGVQFGRKEQASSLAPRAPT